MDYKREKFREDFECAAGMVLLMISEKLQMKPSRRQHKKNEKDYRPVVQQLVSPIPQSVFMGTSNKTREQEVRTQKKTVTFEAPDHELIEVESENSEEEKFVL